MRLKEWVTRQWKRARESRSVLVAFFALVTLGLLVPHFVFAQDTKLLDFAESSATIIANLLTMFTNVLGSLLILLTEVVLTNIMQYNNFNGSTVVAAGWAVVRDIMNMGFVVAMLIIAMVTIFGGSVGSWSVKWQQQIPRLLLFAILINFSRMICGLLIDIGQVIMLTFANAIKDIAGGNIIELFGLRNIVTFSDISKEAIKEAGTGIEGFQLLSTAVLGFLMTLIVFGTMLILTVVLVYRIVTLWVLIVLSPIAFFFGGAKGLFGGKIDPYSMWWERFSSTIAVGPVLVFFLWLALATLGAGSGAVASEFPNTAVRSGLPPGTAETFISKIADPGPLLAFILGIGILFAGFEAASKFADALPGTASNLIKGGVKGALKLGTATTFGAALAGGRLGMKGGKFAGKYAAAPVAKWVGRTVAGQAAIGAVGKGLRGAAGWAGGTFLGSVPLVAGALRGASRAGSSVEAARKKNAVASFKGHEEKLNDYEAADVRAGLASKAMGPDGAMRQQAMRWKALSTDSIRDEMDKGELQTMLQDFIANGGEETLSGDDKKSADFKKLKKTRPDLLSDTEKAKTLSKMDNDEFRQLDEEALEDPAVLAELDNPDRNETDPATGEVTTLRERVNAGKMGKKLQNKLKKIEAGDDSDINTEAITDDALRTLPESRQTEGNFRALSPSQLTVAMENPNFQIQNMPTELLENADVARQMSGLSPEILAGLMKDPAKADAFHTGLAASVQNDERRGVTMSAGDQNKMRTAIMVSSSEASLVSGGVMTAGGDMDADAQQTVGSAVKTAPTLLLNFTSTLQTNNAFTQSALQNVDMKKLNKEARKATASGDPAEIARYEALYEALGARAREAAPGANTQNNDLQRQIEALYEEGERNATNPAETARIRAALDPLEAEQAQVAATIKQLRSVTNHVRQLFE